MNLDEAMYTFGTGEKDLSSVCGPLMLSRFR